MTKGLKIIRDSISEQTLGTTIQQLTDYASENGIGNIMPKIEKIAADYSLMKQFLAQGFEDPQRDQLIFNLQRQLLIITSLMERELLTKDNFTYKSISAKDLSEGYDFADIEDRLLGYDQDLALKSIDTADNSTKDIRDRQFNYRKHIFNRIVTSPLLDETQSAQLQSAILSPLVDDIDKDIIVKALYLALLFVWDPQKFRLLCNTHINTESSTIRIHSLVCIMLSLPSKSEHHFMHETYEKELQQVMGQEGIKQQLVDLQKQLLITKDTDKTDGLIDNNIMSVLKSNADAITKHMTKDDDIAHIINPNQEEEGMEEVEKAIDKIRKLKTSGIDVFYGGLAQTKRLPFFYTLLNWFCPFYNEHPQILSAINDRHVADVVNKIVTYQHVCDSDKYGIMLSLLSFARQMPAMFKEVMDNQDAIITDGDMPTALPELEARQFLLQDLYRFFKLYPYKKDVDDIFDNGERTCFFNHFLVAPYFYNDNCLISIGKQLIKRKLWNLTRSFLDTYKGHIDTIKYVELEGSYAYNKKLYYSALDYYLALNKKVPGNAKYLYKAAECAYFLENYETAGKYYSEILNLDISEEDKEKVLYHLAMCQLKRNDIENAMQTIFRLFYEHPDNVEYLNLVCLYYLKQNNPEKALNYINESEADGNASTNILKAIAHMMLHQYTEAIATFKDVVNKADMTMNQFTATVLQQVRDIEGFSRNEFDVITDIVFS